MNTHIHTFVMSLNCIPHEHCKASINNHIYFTALQNPLRSFQRICTCVCIVMCFHHRLPRISGRVREAGNKRPVYRFCNIIKIYYISFRHTVRTPALKPKQRNTTHCKCTTTCGSKEKKSRFYTACETRNILIGLVRLINFPFLSSSILFCGNYVNIFFRKEAFLKK